MVFRSSRVAIKRPRGASPGPSVKDVKRSRDLEAERRYQDEMANTSKSLSNASFMEWNQRRKGGG